MVIKVQIICRTRARFSVPNDASKRTVNSNPSKDCMLQTVLKYGLFLDIINDLPLSSDLP